MSLEYPYPNGDFILTPYDYQKAALRTMADQAWIKARNWDGLDKAGQPHIIDSNRLVQLDNAARGMAGDVGEVNSCVQKCLEYGQQLDLVNLKEELGDVLWRIVQACDAVGFTLEEVMQANIAKLRARYPDKYSDFLAAEENRDREGEREAVGLVVADEVQLTEKQRLAYANIRQNMPGFPEQNGQGFAEPKEIADV